MAGSTTGSIYIWILIRIHGHKFQQQKDCWKVERSNMNGTKLIRHYWIILSEAYQGELKQLLKPKEAIKNIKDEIKRHSQNYSQN